MTSYSWQIRVFNHTNGNEPSTYYIEKQQNIDFKSWQSAAASLYEASLAYDGGTLVSKSDLWNKTPRIHHNLHLGWV